MPNSYIVVLAGHVGKETWTRDLNVVAEDGWQAIETARDWITGISGVQVVGVFGRAKAPVCDPGKWPFTCDRDVERAFGIE